MPRRAAPSRWRGSTAVVSDRSQARSRATSPPRSSDLWDKIKDKVDAGHAAVLSGATGAEPATAEERAFLEAHGELAVRATGSYLGHGLEPQFPMNVALAAIALSMVVCFRPATRPGWSSR